MNVELKPMTLSDYIHFFKKAPERTIRGYSFFLDGRMVAVFGVLMERDGVMMMFSDIEKDIKVPKITIWRWARKALRMVDDLKCPLYAITINSGKFLQSLGFHYHADTKHGKLYEYVG